MKIAINAVSIKEGGSVIVLRRLLEEFIRQRADCEYHVIVNTRLPDFPSLHHPSVCVWKFPWAEHNFVFTIAWYMFTLPRWIRRQQIGVLFSQTNYLPLHSSARTVLLLQNVSYFCAGFNTNSKPPFAQRLLSALKRVWVNRSLTRADRILVQTHWFAELITIRRPDLRGYIRVVHHGPSLLQKPALPPAPPRAAETLRLLYVCKYGEQKNFSVVFRALRILREEHVHTQLTITLNPDHQGTEAVLAEAAKIGVSGMIANRGDLPPEEVAQLYGNAHVFIFASVAESFGFPMLEAMEMGVPLVAADVPGNREICGDAALYFPSADALSLASTVQRLAADEVLWAECARKGREQVCRFDWANAGATTLSVLIERAALAREAGVS